MLTWTAINKVLCYYIFTNLNTKKNFGNKKGLFVCVCVCVCLCVCTHTHKYIYIYVYIFSLSLSLWLCDPTRVMASSFFRFLDHTQRRITVGRTPLDEWSARRRDLYLTTHNTQNKHPCPRWDSNPRSQHIYTTFLFW
jgi:hypothetical protein